MRGNFRKMNVVDNTLLRVNIWMAGDLQTAMQGVRLFCFSEGLCVTVTPTTYIYTGGEETGFTLGVMNYPRFPMKPVLLEDVAQRLAEVIAYRCCQTSYSLEKLWSGAAVGNDLSGIEWYSRREENSNAS